MNLKQDRRIQYTKKVLREALLELMDKKPLDEISISELCSYAEINRNTFYNHYSFPKQIINELEDEVFNELMKQIKEHHTILDVMIIACRQLEKDKRTSRLIFSDGKLDNLLIRVINTFKNMPIQGNIPKNSEDVVVNFTNEFNEKGSVGVIRYWIANGFKESVESVASFVAGSIKKVITK